MEVDYLIIGQGLAGTALGYTLENKGARVFFINDESIQAASNVAAGLFNPITGKRMTKTWKASELFPFMERFYSSFEKKFNCTVLHSKRIYKPFATIEEQNTWCSAHEGEAFIDTTLPATLYQSYIHAPYGGFCTNASGYIDLPVFISAYRNHLVNSELYSNEKFDLAHLNYTGNRIQYKGLEAKNILFCEGLSTASSTLFNWIPFVPAKGELLNIELENFTDEVIFNKQVFIVPISSTHFRVGATYQWDYTDENTSESAKNELEEKLTQLIKLPYKIISQKAGIRPAIKDRKPVIGFHPEKKLVGIFNGLGSKGVSLAPYFANEFAELLVNSKQIDKEVNIERFYSLYSRSEK